MVKSFCNKKKVFNKIKKLNVRSGEKMYHIKDKDFIRGKVPMTKEEIRAVSIAKMEISDEDVCIDIGGGTGSVSIEMARFAKNGHVYTIEQKEEAVDLIKQNMEKFEIKNMTVISGKAPEDLPQGITFDKVFIGGSGGNLSEIINYSYENLKEGGMIALNFIVLENTFEALECLKKSKFEDIDISQIIVAKNRKVKDFNMMMSENPIYVISARK